MNARPARPKRIQRSRTSHYAAEQVETAGLEVELHASPAEYLQPKRIDAPGCIILDVRLRGSSGLDFQRELARAGDRTPVIFLTGHADIAMTVQAMKAGAVEF